MTLEEARKQIAALCIDCATGNLARYRPETNEWVHDEKIKTGPMTWNQKHWLCGANEFRKEHKDLFSGQ